MTTAQAIDVVVSLAEQNLIDDDEMADERERQEAAIEIVKNLGRFHGRNEA